MWGLATHPTETIFVTCSQEQLVCIWDSKTQENLWTYPIDVRKIFQIYLSLSSFILVRCKLILFFPYDIKFQDSAQCCCFHPTKPFVLVATTNGTWVKLIFQLNFSHIFLFRNNIISDLIYVSTRNKAPWNLLLISDQKKVSSRI